MVVYLKHFFIATSNIAFNDSSIFQYSNNCYIISDFIVLPIKHDISPLCSVIIENKYPALYVLIY